MKRLAGLAAAGALLLAGCGSGSSRNEADWTAAKQFAHEYMESLPADENKAQELKLAEARYQVLLDEGR